MYEKYTRSLELMRQSVPQGTGEVCYESLDALFQYIFDNFEVPKSSGIGIISEGATPILTDEVIFELKECSELLKLSHSDIFELVEKIPPKVSEVLWPVLLMSRIFRTNGLICNHHKISMFKEFVNRYGCMVCENKFLYNPR